MNKIEYDTPFHCIKNDGWSATIITDKGIALCGLDSVETAEFIVDACNNYFKMKEALEEIRGLARYAPPHVQYELIHKADRIAESVLNSLRIDPAQEDKK